MTLSEVIKAMEVVASQQPSIHSIVENDVFRLNKVTDAKYGVFSFVQGQHSSNTENDTISFQFNLFFVDRLKNDKSNQIHIQSTGIQTLENIIRKLDEMGIWSTSHSFQVFNQRFLDECAGVYANVTFQVPVSSVCPESFADFNNDFNDDFTIL